ncbi:MAG: hypothetical protein ABSE89_04000 [Sedimentisphaerales bacterium]
MIFDYIKNTNWLRRNIIVAACVPIAMVAMYNWFVSPQLQYLKAAQKYEDSVDKVEKTNKIIDTQIQAGSRKLDEISQQFEQKKQEFFDIETARTFLGSIQSKAEKNQCVVDTLKFMPANQIANNSSSIDIKQHRAILTITGQYPDIVKLLDSLQNRKQKVWIDTITLHLKDQESGLLVCDVSLSIYTLQVKEIISDVKTEK